MGLSAYDDSQGRYFGRRFPHRPCPYENREWPVPDTGILIYVQHLFPNTYLCIHTFMYFSIEISRYLCISVMQYFRITAFQYLSIEFACFRYRNMYIRIPSALFYTYLHILVFPFSGIAAFPHSSISALPYFHTIGHSERQATWFSQAMQDSPSRGIISA